MAIDIFEEAYRIDPQDKILRARIGHTLIVTHEYHRAVEFYESGVRQILSKLGDRGKLETNMLVLVCMLASAAICDDVQLESSALMCLI